MFPTGPRLYQPIWEKLKADGTVSITANRLLHPRIIKAVVKEKWLDTPYKLALYPWHVKLSYTTSHAVITFKLTKYINFGNVRAHDV